MDKKLKMECLTALEYSEKDTIAKIMEMDEKGTDYIEVLVPFSDPVAENPEIQDASVRAIKNGCTVEKVFEMLDKIKNQLNTKILLSFYANTAYRYGYEAFSKKAKAVGVYGLIVEDMPFDEKSELEPTAKEQGLFVMNIIASKNPERIKMIAEDAEGILCISPSLNQSTTSEEFNSIINIVKEKANVPVLGLCNNEENNRCLVSL